MTANPLHPHDCHEGSDHMYNSNQMEFWKKLADERGKLLSCATKDIATVQHNYDVMSDHWVKRTSEIEKVLASQAIEIRSMKSALAQDEERIAGYINWIEKLTERIREYERKPILPPMDPALEQRLQNRIDKRAATKPTPRYAAMCHLDSASFTDDQAINITEAIVAAIEADRAKREPAGLENFRPQARC